MEINQGSEVPDPAWARVRILLNINDITAAVAEAVPASLATHWRGKPLQPGRWFVFGMSDMPVGWVFFDPDQAIAVMNDQVRDEFAWSMTLRTFMDKQHPLPCFAQYDISFWRNTEKLRGGI